MRRASAATLRRVKYRWPERRRSWLAGAIFAGVMGILRLRLRRLAWRRPGSRCPLRPQRPGRCKQESLSEPDVEIQQVDHRAFALDPLRDQVDAVAAEQVGKVGRMDIRRCAAALVEQQCGRHLDVADAAVGEVARLDPQVGDMVDREPETALRQRRQMFGLDRTEIAECRLLEFEHERRGQRAIGFEEVEALGEHRGIAQRRRATLQNTPTSLLRTIRRRNTWTHAASPCDRSVRSVRRLRRRRRNRRR